MRLKLNLVLGIYFFAGIISNLDAQEDKQVEVENGAVIIDGKYIEPPYLIEVRENGIWINGLLAEKRMPRKVQYRESKKSAIQQAIEHEVLADYFELSEEIGKEKAKGKINEQIIKKNKIRGIKVTNLKSKSAEEMEIQTDVNENVSVKISTSPANHTEDFMLELAVSRKYRKWFKSSGQEEKRALDELVKFLDIQKKKGRIEEYKFEKGYDFEKKDILEIKYSDNLWWSGIGSAYAFTPEDITTIKYPTDEECDKLDKADLQKRKETIIKCLNGFYILVFSEGQNPFGGPAMNIIENLKEIMKNSRLNLEEKKEEIKKVYLPATMGEKYLNEIIENFGR